MMNTPASSEPIDRKTAPPQPPAAGLDERPFQFRVRTLLIVVTAVSVLLAVTRWQPRVGTILIWCVAIVLLHVVATARATRHQRASSIRAGVPQPPTTRSGQVVFARATELERRSRLGWLTIGSVSLGVILGAVLGAGVLCTTYRERMGWLATGLGTLSAGVLGGFAGFLVSTFSTISIRAWRAATQGHHKQPTQPKQPT